MSKSHDNIKKRIERIASNANQVVWEYEHDARKDVLESYFRQFIGHLENLSSDIERGFCEGCGSFLQDEDYLEDKICKICMKERASFRQLMKG